MTSDLQRQTRAALLADPEPKVVELEISSSAMLFFRGRCLAAQDMNSAQTLPRDEAVRLHTTKTVGLPHARGHGELYDGVA